MQTWVLWSMGRVKFSIYVGIFHISQGLSSSSVPKRYPNCGTRMVTSRIVERLCVYVTATEDYLQAPEALIRTYRSWPIPSGFSCSSYILLQMIILITQNTTRG